MTQTDRLQKALYELISCSKEIYGDNVQISIGFDVVLGSTRNDLSNVTIQDFIRKCTDLEDLEDDDDELDDSIGNC